MIIHARAILICPRTKQEIRLDEECVNADGKRTPCLFYKHWLMIGSRPAVCCNYKEEPPAEEPTANEEQIDDEHEDDKEWRKPTFIDEHE